LILQGGSKRQPEGQNCHARNLKHIETSPSPIGKIPLKYIGEKVAAKANSQRKTILYIKCKQGVPQ
jgi:hypothetical protein